MKNFSENQWNELKAELIENDAKRKEIPIGSISLDKDSVDQGFIKLHGKKVPVNDTFFSSLGKVLKLNKSLNNEMIKNNDSGLVASMVNGLKDYRNSKGGGGNVVLVADSSTKQLIDISNASSYNSKRISNESAIEITDRILNSNSNLSIESVDRRPNGNMRINLLNNNEIGFANAGPDEFFKFGFSIIQTHQNTSVEMYNQRLVCENGLTTPLGSGIIGTNRQIKFMERFKLAGSKPEEIREFLQNIEAMRKAEFIPESFEQTLLGAVNTKASLHEVENAMFQTHRLVGADTPELRQQYIHSLSRNYFHGYGLTMQRLARKGLNTNELIDRQKMMIKTPMSVWDLVNSLTFLGSNNSGIQLESKEQLKESAGKIFAKGTTNGYDLQFAEFATL
jgi:hypothetical protein